MIVNKKFCWQIIEMVDNHNQWAEHLRQGMIDVLTNFDFDPFIGSKRVYLQSVLQQCIINQLKTIDANFNDRDFSIFLFTKSNLPPSWFTGVLEIDYIRVIDYDKLYCNRFQPTIDVDYLTLNQITF